MAVHLAECGEVVVPATLRCPDIVDRDLRSQAAGLHGGARLCLLEAALTLRGQRARMRMDEGATAPRGVPPGQ